MQLCETVKHHLDKRTDGIRQIIHAWKERTELLKRACMLVNFNNTSDVRNSAMNLIKMILAISPGIESLQYVIQIMYTSYCGGSTSSQLLLSYTTNSCSNNNNNSSSSSTSSSSSSPSSLSIKYNQCVLTPHLITQSTQLMGQYFPLSKKLTQSQQVAATTASVANGSNLLRSNNNNNIQTNKNMFQMFLPVQFVTHSHINGGITVFNQQQSQSQQQQTSLDYQKALLDSYAQFATFFDWICRHTFSRRLITTTTTTTTTNSSSLDPTTANSLNISHLQTTKQLIDLILVISQQTLLMNVSFVAHLNEYLQEQLSTPTTATDTGDTTNNTSGFDSSLLNETGLDFYNLILDSNYFNPFVNTVLMDYRYLLNKKEIYEFMHIFLTSFIISNPKMLVLKSTTTTTTNSKITPTTSSMKPPSSQQSASSVLLNLKSFIEISCKTINEIRFYFEFNQLSKHLSAAAATTTTNSSPPNLPNITHNLDFKSSQMLGSIKLIYLFI